MRTLHIKTSRLCDRLFKLERQGRYEDALAEIGDLWLDKTGLPDTEGLDMPLAAEFILRCGSVFGFLGDIKQIPDSQEKSRNLLTHARNLFIEQYNVEKIAECENYLALTYWRTGELNEANIWLDEAFSHNLNLSSKTRIYTYIIKSLVLLSKEHHTELLDLLLPLEETVRNCSDYCLKGSFYNQVGNAWENLGNIPIALQILELAKGFYQKARHQVYYGVILNDLAFLYTTSENFKKAHETVDTATKIFKKIKDRPREGFSLDTKARIYRAEGKFDEALKIIEKAAGILTVGENACYLVKTYGTKIKILISMNQTSAATFCLLDAIQIAKSRISEEAADNLVREYEKCLRQHLVGSKNTAPKIKTPSENKYNDNFPAEDTSFDNIELVLPSPLRNFQDIQGIWINNTHLESVGLVKNSLAVVVPADNIEPGNLIAVEETANENVSCGFYEFDFGMVCLERLEGEPLLFEKEDISIIGKIVGVATERTTDGKYIVRQLFP